LQQDAIQLRGSALMPLLGALSLGTLSYMMYIGLPIIMGAISDQYQLDEQKLGWIASADLAGLFFGSVVTSVMISRVGFRKIGVIGILIAVIGNGMSFQADSAVFLAAARFVADFGGGVCHALGLACLARLKNPSRNFSLFMVVIVVIGSAWLFALPAVAGRWGVEGVFAILLFAYAIPAMLLKYVDAEALASDNSLPNDNSQGQKEAGAVITYPSVAAWTALGGVLFFYAGATAFWAFAERLGVSIDLAPDFMSLTFTICNISTLAGCWLAYKLDSTWGPFTPNMVVLLLTVLVFLLSIIELADWSYVTVIFFFFQAWAISAIFQMASISEIDPTGRFVALVPASQGVGMTIGPALSGFLLGHGLPLKGLAGVNATFMFLTFLAFYSVYIFIKKNGYSHVTKRH
jgi:predicted MFS family arabinose efflux permease